MSNLGDIPEYEHWKRNALACEHVLGWVGVGIRRVVDTSGSGCTESNVWRGLESSTANELRDVPAFHRGRERVWWLVEAIKIKSLADADTIDIRFHPGIIERYMKALAKVCLGNEYDGFSVVGAWSLFTAEPWQIRDAALIAVGVAL